MNKSSIDAAVDAARKFIASAAKAKEKVQTFSGEDGPTHYLPASKESGDLRRKSMDLTRALADLRKPS
jgi:hypothetical protein